MENLTKSSGASYPDLRKEDIKACEEFKDMNDELAEQLAEAIRIFTEIIYNCYVEERFEEQKLKVISMQQKVLNKAA